MNPPMNITFIDWALGMEFNGFERVFASDRYAFGQIWSELVLTGKTEISAIPLPPAILLFGSALIGLAASARRRRVA